MCEKKDEGIVVDRGRSCDGGLQMPWLSLWRALEWIVAVWVVPHLTEVVHCSQSIPWSSWCLEGICRLHSPYLEITQYYIQYIFANWIYQLLDFSNSQILTYSLLLLFSNMSGLLPFKWLPYVLTHQLYSDLLFLSWLWTVLQIVLYFNFTTFSFTSFTGSCM